MYYVIKSNDGYYMKLPGESPSSRYDDEGYSTNSIYRAILFTDEQEAKYAFNKEGRFSRDNSRVILVSLQEELAKCTT